MSKERIEKDLIRVPTRRKCGIALEQKLDSSQIRWSEMNRTYRKDKKESNMPGEDELGFMKSYVTRPMCGTNYGISEGQTIQHLTAEFEQMRMVVNSGTTAAWIIRPARGSYGG